MQDIQIKTEVLASCLPRKTTEQFDNEIKQAISQVMQYAAQQTNSIMTCTDNVYTFTYIGF